MEIVEMVSFVIVAVSAGAVLIIRVIPGAFRIMTNKGQALEIRSIGPDKWGVYKGGEFAQQVKVEAGQTITWTLSTHPDTLDAIENQLEINKQLAQSKKDPSLELFIIELSLPSSVFTGFSATVEHHSLVVHRVRCGNEVGYEVSRFIEDGKSSISDAPKSTDASVSSRVAILGPPGTYPYAIEITRDTGTFAKGGSHTRIHLGPG